MRNGERERWQTEEEDKVNNDRWGGNRGIREETKKSRDTKKREKNKERERERGRFELSLLVVQ